MMCHEEKGDEFFDLADSYEGKAAKAFKELHAILDSSNSMMYSWRVVSLHQSKSYALESDVA